MKEIVIALIALFGTLAAAGIGLLPARRSYKLERAKLARSTPAAARVAPPGRAKRLRAARGRVDGMRKRIVDDLGSFRILTISKPLKLEKIYIQVRVHEQGPLRYERDDELNKAAKGDPAHLMHLTMGRRQQRSGEVMSPEEALGKYRRVVLLGDPGAGKTTMLRHLALLAAREDLGVEDSLPIFVELRHAAGAAEPDILSYAAKLWYEQYGFADAAEFLDAELAAGRAILLLDGLDEVQSGPDAETAQQGHDRIVAEIDRLANRYPEALIAVTCRKASWRGQLARFRTLDVLDFDADQIDEFIGNWFEDDEKRAKGLREALAVNTRILTLSANPLLLSLIAIVYASELELPERRAELYKRTVSVLLNEWDSHRGIKRFSRFTSDRKRDLLTEIAWCFHQRGLAYFAKDELLEVIADFLPSIDLRRDDAEGILEEIVTQYGLLREQAHDVYGFLHLTLQEFFAAEAVAEAWPSTLPEVAARRHDPWWEEVILLLVGRLRDASPLLLAILGRGAAETLPPAGQPLAADDDVLHSDLFASGRCLIGTPRVRLAGLRERIIAELREMYISSPHQMLYDKAASLLAEIGGDTMLGELALLVTDTSLGQERRATLLQKMTSSSFGVKVLSELLPQLDEGDGELVSAVAEQLAGQDGANAVPFLLARLRKVATSIDSAGNEASALADALRKAGNTAAVPVLREALDAALAAEFYNVAPSPLFEALVALGDVHLDEVVPLLREESKLLDSTIVDAIAELNQQGSASLLVAAMLDPRTRPDIIDDIARHLRERPKDLPVEVMIEAARDERFAWPLRWLVLTALRNARETSERQIRELYLDLEVDERIRVAATALLACWGDREAYDRLCRAKNDEAAALNFQIPLSRFGYLQYAGDPDWLVDQAFTEFAEESEVPLETEEQLSAEFARKAKENGSHSPLEVSASARELIDRMAPRGSEIISRHLLALLETTPLEGEWPVLSAVWDLSRVLPDSLALETLRRLSPLEFPVAAGEDLASLAVRIASAVEPDGVELARELCAIHHAPPRGWQGVDLFEALAIASERTRIRFFADGRVALPETAP
ncbi:NACHT domain-containing protein [Microbispora bryophytorum]|uniref:NACHT domain-containing protein n=1 Tax=Microbispora bryophytorum TaxID=1460882 RepID=UPI0033D1FE3B